MTKQLLFQKVEMIFQISIVYKNDIFKYSYIQTTLFFKYFFNLCSCSKTCSIVFSNVSNYFFIFKIYF